MLRIMRTKEVCRVFGWAGKSTALNQVKRGLLTPFIKVGTRASGLPEHEAEIILRARIAGKNDDEIRQLVQDLIAARKSSTARITGSAA